MLSRLSCCLAPLVFVGLATAQTSTPGPARSGGDFAAPSRDLNKVPQGVLLVKGAWASASDSVTPVPEGGTVIRNVFNDAYFGMSYALPQNWEEKYHGPPPSESGRYVLAQLRPPDSFKGARATILISAEDMFFTPLPAKNALQLIKYSSGHLQTDYKIEMPPTPTRIAGRPFTFYAYWSPIAELHWYVMATDIRCHAVQIIVSSRDTKLLENLVLDLNKMKIPGEGEATSPAGDPACIQDYARDVNMTARVDPVFSERRFNSVPVRIIIDKQGNIRHIHFLSAFPDQEKAITAALHQWKFKPYLQNGKPAEVETGIAFGRSIRRPAPSEDATKTTD